VSARLAVRVALLLLVVSALLVGVWAAVAPRSFYLDFPGSSHTWVLADGPYNEHLVRDVGELNLALAAVTACAALWLTRAVVLAAALAWLVYSLPHFAYHAANLHVLSGSDQPAELVSLAIPILLAGVVLALGTRAEVAAGPAGGATPRLSPGAPGSPPAGAARPAAPGG
jgi:hypothetical protein